MYHVISITLHPYFKRGYQRIMAYKNNRNSREDKSLKHKRFEGSSKNEQPEKSNTGKKKLFEQQADNSFTGRSKSQDNPGRRTEKPFGKKPFEGKGRAGDKPSSGRSFEKRPFEGRDENRPESRSFPKKSFGSDREAGAKGAYGEGRDKDRPYSTKKYNSKEKPEGGRSFDNKPFKSAGRNADKNERPGSYERRPYSKKAGDEKRSWSSEEHLEHKPQIRARKNAPAAKPAKDDGLIRLNRYIANAGICSRRKADELIEAGVVSVNGEIVSELGYKVDPAKDVIRYNGETLKREKMTYVLLNKPKDYITTTDDPQERRTVMQLVEKASKERIYPVGRLDRNTTGLILMTNDGDLAEKLSHPRNNVTKIYQVELNKNLTQGDFNKIQYGLELEDGLIKPDVVSYVQGGSKREIGIQIHSGKNRIVRRIFEHLGYEVVKLDRVIYANLTKKDLPRGRWRYLEEKEIIQLKHLIR